MTPCFAHWPPSRAGATARRCRQRPPRCTAPGLTPEPKHSRQRSGQWRTPTPTKPASQHRRRRGRSRCSWTACASTSLTEYTRGSLTLASMRRVAPSLSALPTVTQTAKAALAPTTAGSAGARSRPACRLTSATGTKASIQVLRTLMAENGVQVLAPERDGRPIRHSVDRGRRDRPPWARRRRSARRLPRRGGRPDRRPDP